MVKVVYFVFWRGWLDFVMFFSRSVVAFEEGLRFFLRVWRFWFLSRTRNVGGFSDGEEVGVF